MPDLYTLALDRNPSEHPLSYPGQSVPSSCLLLDWWLYPLRPGYGHSIEQWGVKHDGGPLPLSGTDALGAAIAVAGATPMTRRVPIVAVGSNASPAQLVHKYRHHRVDQHNAIPITRIETPSLSVAHSAHVSASGYVPFIPVLSDSGITQSATLYVLWLDSEQLQTMDESEPNYTRVTVSPSAAVNVRLESGLPLESFELYRGRWGALCSEPGGSPMTATSQETVWEFLAAHQWARAIIPELCDGAQAAATALARDERRREQLRDDLARHDLVAPDRLAVEGIGTTAARGSR